MSTYREFLLQTSAIAQDFTFDQALRWMDAHELFELGKREPRPKKKRASRLSKTLAELQQAAPKRSSPIANLQPIFCNSKIEAALPSETDTDVAGPFFASYRDSSIDTAAYAASSHRGWEKYRHLGSLGKSEVFFSPLSPNQTAGKLQTDRAEFETQAIQLTEIFTRLLCSEQPQERTFAKTFRRPQYAVKYTGDSVNAIDPNQFAPDATYLRDGQQVSVFLPCAFWWKKVGEFHQFIVWLVDRCESQQLCYELWQPGLIRNIRS